MNKDVKKLNKLLKIILIVLAIIIALVIIDIIVIQFDGFLDTSNPMTKEEVIDLLEKGENYSNYYYSPQDKFFGLFDVDNSNKTEIYIKDNIINTVYNGKTLRWDNYNTNETINIWGEYKGKNTASIGDLSTNEKILYNQGGFDYSIIADNENFGFNFKYLGKKQVNGKTNILVKVWNKEKPEIVCTKFLIDEQTGLVTKRIDYSFVGIFLINIVCDRNIKLNEVTDEDIARPDLTGYEILQ